MNKPYNFSNGILIGHCGVNIIKILQSLSHVSCLIDDPIEELNLSSEPSLEIKEMSSQVVDLLKDLIMFILVYHM